MALQWAREVVIEKKDLVSTSTDASSSNILENFPINNGNGPKRSNNFKITVMIMMMVSSCQWIDSSSPLAFAFITFILIWQCSILLEVCCIYFFHHQVGRIYDL